MLKSFAIGAGLALLTGGCGLVRPVPDQTAQTAVKPPAGCVAQTATRVAVKDDACAGAGNTYSKQDIQNTGQQQIGPALSTLDPSLGTRGH